MRSYLSHPPLRSTLNRASICRADGSSSSFLPGGSRLSSGDAADGVLLRVLSLSHRLSIYAVLLVLAGLTGNWVYKRFFYKRPISKGVSPTAAP